MKAAVVHFVPLPPRANEVLEQLKTAGQSQDLAFPGSKPDKPLSNMVFLMALRRMEKPVTAHGFRSAFRDWAGETTSFPREIAEAALAHVSGDATERAYRGGDALEKRRGLMEAWTAFCEPGQRSNVVPMPRQAGIEP
jgi:integrase